MTLDLPSIKTYYEPGIPRVETKIFFSSTNCRCLCIADKNECPISSFKTYFFNTRSISKIFYTEAGLIFDNVYYNVTNNKIA